VSFFGTSFKNVPTYSTTGFAAMMLILVVLVVGILAVFKRQSLI
jgi:Mg2+ and Co2+ transporter CorA